MADSIDKGIPLMTPTFFGDNDPDNPKRKTYIELEALIKKIVNTPTVPIRQCYQGNFVYADGTASRQNEIIDYINNQPTADVVPSSVLEQVMWERDMALETLKEHGIGFCEKSDVVEVVRCKDCEFFSPKTDICRCHDTPIYEDDFCSYGERKEE